MKNNRFIRGSMYGLVSLMLALPSCGGGGRSTSPNNTGVRQVSGVNGITAVLRTISITPSNPLVINSGTQLQFTATGSYADNSVQDLTAQVVWASSDTSVATVSNASDSKGPCISSIQRLLQHFGDAGECFKFDNNWSSMMQAIT
jgi:hypothetical protein